MEKRTISLTNRRPVTVNVDVWPVVAKASNYTKENQPIRLCDFFVRQCEKEDDSRCIVYAVYRSRMDRESSMRCGEIVDGMDGVLNAIKRLVAELHANVPNAQHEMIDRMARECIADLPAVEI